MVIARRHVRRPSSRRGRATDGPADQHVGPRRRESRPGRRATRSASATVAPAGEVARPVQAAAGDRGDLPFSLDRDLLAVAEGGRRRPGSRRPSRANSSGSSDVAWSGPRHRPVQGQVLLDERRAERGRGERQVGAGRVVRPAGRQAERLAHRLASRAGRRPGRGRIAGHAMEQAPAARGPAARIASTAAATSTMWPSRSRRASGRPRRASRARNGRFVSSPGPDLEGRHVERIEEIGRGVVERRGQEDDAAVVGVVAQAGPGVRRQRQAREHRPLVLRPGRRPPGTPRSGAAAAARASGRNVWNLTASAPVSAAASTSRWAISTSPS